MSLTWTLSEIRSKIRQLTGKPSTSQLSDDSISDKVNDFYQNKFPFDIDSVLLNGHYTVMLSATDSGQYTLPATVLQIKEPIKINGADVTLTQDEEWFLERYPKDTGTAYVISDTGASLSVGADPTKVANSAFYYTISGNSYYKAAAETALSGSTIPQNKYGAWRLEIATDGTISIVEADDNSTGYLTPSLAIAGISGESASNACMGFVTAISTDAGGFIPGTTSLSDAAVTDTYTDGYHSTRNTPQVVLLLNGVLYAGPKPSDWMELKAPYLKKPDALSSDSSVPLDVQWGEAIAYGTAMEIMMADRRIEKSGLLKIYYDDCVSRINGRHTKQENVTRRVKASF